MIFVSNDGLVITAGEVDDSAAFHVGDFVSLTGLTIKSAGSGKYIGIEGNAEDGTPLVAVDNAYVWNIWPDERDNSHFRIFAPNTNKNFDLSDHGSSTPGTKVQLWDKTPGKGQTWIIGQ